jgi:NIL domain
MSNLQIDINIPQQLHQEPVLAKLIGDYNLIVNFQSAILDRKATGGGWFNLSLDGDPQSIASAINYLRNLGVEIFTHGSAKIENLEVSTQTIDRLLTSYDL